MKYWKFKIQNKVEYSENVPKSSWYYLNVDTGDKYLPDGAIVTEITKEEYDLYKTFNIQTPDKDPSTGQAWANDLAKQTWIKGQLWDEGVKAKADKGQEVENALELNDAIKSYAEGLLRGKNFEIFGILGELAKNPTDITIDRRFNDKMKEWKAYNSLISNIENYERGLAIATNSDSTHPIDPRNESVFVGVLTQISTQEKPLWLEITKMLNVEETYEPEMVKNEYIKLQQLVNTHVTGGHTLASELPPAAGGTQTK